LCAQEARELFKNPEVVKVEDVEVGALEQTCALIGFLIIDYQLISYK